MRKIVCGVKRLQYNPCIEDTEICEGDKPKKRNRREPGAEVEFRDDVCTGINGDLLEGYGPTLNYCLG